MSVFKGAAGILAATLLMVGCGSSDDAATTVDVTVKEFEFDPAKWTITADQETTLNLTNDGALVHEWVILQDGVTVESESDLPETEEDCSPISSTGNRRSNKASPGRLPSLRRRPEPTR